MKWTRHKVTVLAATIFAAHVIAIFALHTPPPMVMLPDGFRAPLRPLTPPTTNGLAELDGLNDPLVFAGAHQHGFSAAAWMIRPHLDYTLTNSAPQPRYLAFSRTAADFPPTDTKLFSRHDQNLPFVDFQLPVETPRSRLAIEGDLRNRTLTTAPEIPIQYASDVLSNSVVQIGVRADGFPFTARIVSGSGSRAADLTALDIANKLRFVPASLINSSDSADPAALQWGELQFQWFTTEPSATNAPPKTSVSAAK
jgi:hypothetical protein